MQRQPQVFFSNRLELLYEELKGSLYADGISPFARRIVIVSSAGMRSWLQLRLAKDPSCGIAAGLEIDLAEPSIGQLCRSLLSQQVSEEAAILPREQELSFLFEQWIQKTIERRPDLNATQKRSWEPLLEYLKVSPGHSKRKATKRLIGLCDNLAMLFCQYGRYGSKMLAEWETGDGDSWQADLWRQLKEAHPDLAFPSQLLDKAAKALEENRGAYDPCHLQIHLFGVSFLAKKAHEFFMRIGAAVPVHYYLLSPCQLFWSDIRSDREALRLKSFWASRSISENQHLALDEFLRDRNVLLGNFGRMGREMALQIEETIDNTSERYLLPEAVTQIPQYSVAQTEETIFEASEAPFSLLQAIQTDMALLRTLNDDDKIALSSTDNSLQLHIAPTKQREVEILYNVLVGLLTESAASASPLASSDIIVMVPDLLQYEAAIAGVFGSDDSLLDYQLCEMRMAAKSSLVQGFLHLLTLSTGRWETAELLGLLDYPSFRHQQGISYEEMQQIEKWTDKAGVYWGQTPQHRDMLLQRDHRQRKLVDPSPGGTWDYSAKRLLMGMAVEAAGLDSSSLDFAPPLEGVEVSQTLLISKWILLLKSLQEDLKPLSDGTRMTLREWSSYLTCLKETYFQIEGGDSDFHEEEVVFTEQIEAIGRAGKLTDAQTYSFESVKSRLEKSLKEASLNFHDMHLQAIKFCPLLPMRALPAKVVAMLGMQEETFPKKDMAFSLNEMTGNLAADYCPSQSEFDRYLFLEALLSARETFLLSYVGYSFADQKECAPSLVIQELVNYIDDGYTIDGESPSGHCIKKHPFQSFDSSYFSGTSAFPSYRQIDYDLALAHYRPTKLAAHRFIADFTIAPQKVEEGAKLNLKSLSSFASNPLKTYFNQALGIYLKKDVQRSEHEPFALGSLEKYQIRKKGIQSAFATMIEQVSKRGELPPGMFKTLAVNELKNDVEEMHANFASAGVHPDDLFCIRFSEKCEIPSRTDEKILTLPPLQLYTDDGQPIKIIGSLNDVSSAGLLFYQDRDFKSLLKIWPQFLVLQCAIEQFQLPIACQAVSSKHAQPISLQVNEPALELMSFINYYHIGINHPSLLLPEWVEPILAGNPEVLRSRMEGIFDNPFSSFYNEYALWLFRDINALPDPERFMTNWGPLAGDLFSGLLSMTKGGKKK